MTKPFLVENAEPRVPPALGAKPVKTFKKDWGIGHTTFYKEKKAGRIKTVKIGRRTLVLAEDERAYADLLRSEAA